MGILDRLFGQDRPPRREGPTTDAAPSTDEQAVARYRYMLRTAPPEAIEQAHAEAFARLTAEQRAEVLRQLSEELPEAERAGDARRDDPRTLARMATRAEIRRPGTLERRLGSAGTGGAVGMGGMFAGGLLSAIAGTVIGTAIARQFFGGYEANAAEQSGGTDPADADASDGSAPDADESGSDFDDASDVGDSGDFGGGDLGGGDFGDL